MKYFTRIMFLGVIVVRFYFSYLFIYLTYKNYTTSTNIYIRGSNLIIVRHTREYCYTRVTIYFWGAIYSQSLDIRSARTLETLKGGSKPYQTLEDKVMRGSRPYQHLQSLLNAM